MSHLDRRRSPRIAGTTSAIAAGPAVLPVAGSLAWTGADAFRFRAVTGLSEPSLPACASYVIIGQVYLAARSGMITTALYAGSPDTMAQFPGLTRLIRITAVTTAGRVLNISGLVYGASALRPGQTRSVDLSIDRRARRVHANFLGDEVLLDLEQLRSPSTAPSTALA